METDEIIRILFDWNLWGKKQETGIVRAFYTDFIHPFFDTNQVIVVTGIRRSGKSTIMLQLAKTLVENGVKPEDTLFVNFEDYRFYNLSLKTLDEVYDAYLRKIAKNKKIFLFFDEIHKIKGWEKFVRTLVDKKEATILVSGSNTKLMGKEYGELLTGRHIKVLVLPLDFKEFLLFNGLKIGSELEIISESVKIRKLLDTYIEYGSFPEVVLARTETKKKILIDYLESIITKDVVERHKIKEKAKLMALTRYYFSNISSKISFNKLKEFLDIPLRTVERFSYYLEEAYLVFFLKRFSFKVKEQEKSNRKVYVADVGLANVLGFKFSTDIGKIIENIVFLELIKRNANKPNFEIYYWQDFSNKEVDFVIKENQKIKQLIQVCYTLTDLNTKEREIQALLKASRELKCKNLIIINNDFAGEEKIKGLKIKFIPLWKWLLN